jgi:branched-chain amino acid transport system substrate-binding protein
MIAEVKGGRVVYAYDNDKKGGGQLRAKRASIAA